MTKISNLLHLTIASILLTSSCSDSPRAGLEVIPTDSVLLEGHELVGGIEILLEQPEGWLCYERSLGRFALFDSSGSCKGEWRISDFVSKQSEEYRYNTEIFPFTLPSGQVAALSNEYLLLFDFKDTSMNIQEIHFPNDGLFYSGHSLTSRSYDEKSGQLVFHGLNFTESLMEEDSIDWIYRVSMD